MEMLNRQRIAPRVLVHELRGRYTGTPLDKNELARVLYALKKTGIDGAFDRVIDDSVRYALDQLLEDM